MIDTDATAGLTFLDSIKRLRTVGSLIHMHNECLITPSYRNYTISKVKVHARVYSSMQPDFHNVFTRGAASKGLTWL